MFDFSWGDGGITVYWPGNNQVPVVTGLPPGYYNGNQTQISTGTLIVLALVAYLLLKK